MTRKSTNAKKLEIRGARISDIPQLQALCKKVYPGMAPYSADQFRGHITHFPQGTFVAEYDGKVVGYCATIIQDDEALRPHTWRSITGGGYGSTHDPDGDYLYGYEVCVDPDYRGLHIGRRLYGVRRQLCVELHLKGIVFGGRLPGLKKRFKDVGSAQDYVKLVEQKKLRDPVLSFQMRNGFEPIGVLPDYSPTDEESMGYATHMLWRNTATEAHKQPSASGRRPGTVRVATIQYLQRRIQSFDEFAQILRYFVSEVADKKCDFVLFPELFAMQLLSMDTEDRNGVDAMKWLAALAPRINELFRDMAIKHHVNIVAGSYPILTEAGTIENVCYVFLRDGAVHAQSKIHPTPDEKYWWGIEGGNTLSAIQTDCGPIGVLICYDSEFPELGRHLVANQGANILFVPFSTEERHGYLRVRYCAQARAVENQCFVVTAGNIGNLPRFKNMDIHYAQSGIFTPCDFPFARDGIAADTTPNVEMIAFADLELDVLAAARKSGSVLNLKDRRPELYHVVWSGPG